MANVSQNLISLMIARFYVNGQVAMDIIVVDWRLLFRQCLALVLTLAEWFIDPIKHALPTNGILKNGTFGEIDQ